MRSLLKRIFFITVTSSLIVGGLFIFPQYGKGYNDKTTHPALTDEIVDFYNLSFTNKLTDEEKEWIVEGSINEDIPPRWINHFYDPTTGEGWKSENLGDVAPITLQIFSKMFLNATTETVSSKNWVHNELLQAKYADYGGNRTWENAIRRYVNGDKEYAYRTLGDVLHLLEDKTVPDHTRNDTHAHEGSVVTGDGGSPYEDYASNYTRGNLVIAPDLKKENKSPIIFGSLDEYFDYLANYSNNNFFSEHTITSGKYEYPKILREDGGYGYGKNRSEKEEVLVNIKFISKENFDIEKFYTLKNNQNENLVLSSYFSRLSREAVLSGAGVISLFYEEVAKAEKDKNLIKEEPTISWWQKMRSPGYGIIVPTIHMAVDGAAWVHNTSVIVINKVADVTTSIIHAVVDGVVWVYDTSIIAINNIADTTTSILLKIPTLLSKTPTSQGASLIDAVSPSVVSPPILTEGKMVVVNNSITAVPETGHSGSKIQTTIREHSLDMEKSTNLLVETSRQPIIFSSIPIVAAAPQSTQNTFQGSPSEPLEEQATTTPTEITPADTAPPTIIILGENPITIYTGGHYADAGATASDEIDGVRTVSLSSNVNTFTAGSYTITYTATDLAGNIATTTRTVNVLDAVTTLAYSDLNENGTADSDEGEVVALSSTSLPAGEYRFNNLTITASSTLTLMGDLAASTTFRGVKITARNITVDVGSSISADMQGYNQEISGPGAAIYPGGASYGGVGSSNVANSVYGSATYPTELGSSGPSVCCSINKNGGGAIRLVVAETLANNGTISADGSSPSTSGGSIYVTTNNLAGDGSFHANGGSGSAYYYTGAGSGGRVAIYYQNSSYRGTAEALGGLHYDGWSSFSRVGSGTTGFFDTINNDFYARAPWQFLASDGPFTFNRIIIENGATVSVEDGARVTANDLFITGASSLSFGSGSVIAIPSILIDGQSSLIFSGNETFTTNTLSIMGTSTVSVARGVPLVLSVRDLTLSAGSSINVDGKGYSPTTGPGTPIEYYDGASYGGAGYNNSATSTYGSVFSPVDMGSGGNGHGSYAYGGGAVKLLAIGTLNIDGMISANGGQTSSGGSIYLVAETVIGNGALRAGGGGTYWSGQDIGPGGGGRIAIDSPNSLFSGSMSASGTCYSSSGYLIGCSEDGTVVYGASIVAFDFTTLSPSVLGSINERAHTINLAVPHGTDITALAPTITVSRGASVSPVSGEAHDFTSPVLYAVTSATSSIQTYTVTVTVAPAPPDTTPPTIVNYMLNGVEESVTTASTTVAVTLTITASEDVDWVSIKIENEGEPNNYKIFYSGTNCTDETTTCAKIWDGVVSHGEFTSGTYRVKVRMRDAVGNEFLEYLTPHVIIVE